MQQALINPLKTDGARNLAILFARLALGATFLAAGVAKVGHIGVGNFVDSSSKFIPNSIPLPIGQTYLYIVPFAECLVGALLVLGLLTRTASVIAVLLLISFTIAVTGVMVRDRPSDWLHVHQNLVYLGTAALLAVCGGGGISLDRQVFKAGP